MNKKIRNFCADCGEPTTEFLCDRCAAVCDSLTVRGEYWFRKIKPMQQSVHSESIRKTRRDSRIR